MNRYEKAIFNTIADCEGLYNYFRDIWKEEYAYINLVLALENYFNDYTNQVPFLYQDLLTTMLDSNLIDFWVVAENLVDLF